MFEKSGAIFRKKREPVLLHHTGVDIYQILKAHVTTNTDTGSNKEDTGSIWNLMGKKVDVYLKRPQKKEKNRYEIVEEKKKRQISYLIKEKENKIYISLNEQEFFVWELLDGNHTIREICNIYFSKYKKLSSMPFKLINMLENKNMLETPPWNIYNAVYKIHKRGIWEILKKISSFFINSRLSLKNSNGFLEFVYNKFAWIFFKKEFGYLFYSIIIAGLFVFFGMGYYEQRYSLKNYLTIKLSIVILLLFSLLPVVFHELAHAFACKNYRREVNKAGLMIYMGLPVLFVETTDIWMRPLKERIFVSLAGPLTDLFVGSICFLIHKLIGNSGILQVLPIVGLIAYFRCLYNFNPLLEFDGYYVLMDLLGIPELRKKSFKFISSGGIKKILSFKKMKKEEYIFLVFGLGAGVYTYWMIFFMLYMWQTKIRDILTEIWERQFTSIFSQILIFIGLSFLLIRIMFLLKLLYKKIQPIFTILYNKLSGKISDGLSKNKK